MATKRAEHSSGLIRALKFMELSGSEHCFIGSNQITAYSESIAVGHPIEEDLNAIAHIKYLKNALLKSPTQTKITQLELSKLQVDTGEFTVYVNAGAEYAHTSPDAFVMQLPASLGQAMVALLPLVGTSGDNPALGSILLRSGSMFATNRRVLAEYWHGIDLPVLNIPKELVKVVAKSKKNLSGFGFSENSITFYFTDGSWAMGRLVKGSWFEPTEFFNPNAKLVDIPKDFAQGISAIKPFVDAGKIYFPGNAVCSHKEYNGAKFNLANPTPEAIFALKDFEWILANFSWFDCNTDSGRWYFFGENIRCVLASIEE